MLMTEAHWVGSELGKLPCESLSPLLNVGSATAEFREMVQPWIHSEIFAPLTEREVDVCHVDVQNGDGIDINGDLTDTTFVEKLKTRHFRSLLCCNVLEHIPDRERVCNALEELIPPGGYLIVTVPNKFPYHPDPVDTMFRPTPKGLSNLFPRCCLIRGTILDCGTGWDYVGRDPQILVAKVKRRLSGMQDHGGVKGTSSFIPWLFRRFKQTCIVLRKV